MLLTRVPDRPGTLARLLVAVADTGANIVDVSHVREGLDLHVRETAIELVLETRGHEHAEGGHRRRSATPATKRASSIDNSLCRMLDVEVIDDPAAAVVALDPVRARLLAELTEPASAAALAERVGLARQKVNYHLRTLEAHGLVEPAGERRWGGLTERLLVATAASYVVSPAALGAASDPERADRLSARYLVALGARIVREVAALARRAERTGKRLPMLALDTEIRFRSAGERAAFADELTAAVTALVARYHDDVRPSPPRGGGGPPEALGGGGGWRVGGRGNRRNPWRRRRRLGGG